MTYLTRTREAAGGGPSIPDDAVSARRRESWPSTHNYFQNVHTLKTVVSAILAVVLWPLLYLGISLHVH